MPCCLFAHSHPFIFPLSFSLSSTLTLNMCLAWTDEKFQGENRGFQKLHERQRKNWHYELETQGERRHKQMSAMQSTTIPPNQPAHLIAYSTHMPMSCSKSEKEKCTYSTWPLRNITHLFRSTNSFCSQMFPKPFGNTSFTSNQVWKMWQAKWDLLSLSLKSRQLILIHQSVMDYNEETEMATLVWMNYLYNI